MYGNHRLYRLRPEGLLEASGFLEQLWVHRLGRLKRAAEQEEQAHPRNQDAEAR